MQDDKFTAGGGITATPQSGWDVPTPCLPRSHQEQPALPGEAPGSVRPRGERKPQGKVWLPCPHRQHGQPSAPQHNLLRCCHQGPCKDPWPPNSRWQPPCAGYGLHPCNPPSQTLLSEHSQHVELQHPSPSCATGMVPMVHPSATHTRHRSPSLSSAAPTRSEPLAGC